MIAVIADDLTGAAELGGIGLRYGLTVEIVTTLDKPSQKDLLIIATDTRSMPEEQALKTMDTLTAKLHALKPDLIYKKVDSVLRGHIIAELKVHLKQLHIKSALLVPANLALGRSLTNGNYLLHGKPIHLSSFVNDPEFAITSSDVRSMLRANGAEVYVQTGDKKLPESGITVGECITNDDFKIWVGKAHKDILLAGSSGFFIAILESLNWKKISTHDTKDIEYGQPTLFVCGSTFNKSKQLVKQLKNNKGPVSYMPADIVKLANPPESLFEQWADEVIIFLNQNKKAVVAIDEDTTANIELIAGDLREKTARVIETVFKRVIIKELLIEGGATAAAIINQLNFNHFLPVQELGTGVIRMKAEKNEGLFLTLKPGSYDWPLHIWNFDQEQ